jgi:hypothetical protein
MIVMHDRLENLETLFAHVEKAGHVGHPYAMPDEHFDIFYCRGLKRPLKDVWRGLKNWN